MAKESSVVGVVIFFATPVLRTHILDDDDDAHVGLR